MVWFPLFRSIFGFSKFCLVNLNLYISDFIQDMLQCEVIILKYISKKCTSSSMSLPLPNVSNCEICLKVTCIMLMDQHIFVS